MHSIEIENGSISLLFSVFCQCVFEMLIICTVQYNDEILVQSAPDANTNQNEPPTVIVFIVQLAPCFVILPLMFSLYFDIILILIVDKLILIVDIIERKNESSRLLSPFPFE